MSQLAAPMTMIHNLSIAAPVNRLRWRPPCHDGLLDRHDSMLVVATASIRGGAHGGPGVLALWSYHRPFMALSVVDGHREGGITDFDWLDDTTTTTTTTLADQLPPSQPHMMTQQQQRSHYHREYPDVRVPGLSSHENDSIVYDNTGSDRDDERDNVETASSSGGIWQLVISLGRDGRCLVQSFVRGTFGILSVSTKPLTFFGND
jgi:WD repeat-containing protein 24